MVKGSKEKHSLKGRSSCLGVLCKKGFLKTLALYTVKYLLSKISSMKLQVFSIQLYQKNLLRHRFFTMNFKCTSQQLLLQEHWVLLKMVPMAIAINVSNTSYQKQFELFSFLRSASSKFMEMSIHRNFCKLAISRFQKG